MILSDVRDAPRSKVALGTGQDICDYERWDEAKQTDLNEQDALIIRPAKLTNKGF